MSLDCLPCAVAQPAAREVSLPRGKRRQDRIDEPARPLGAKRTALHLRRQRNGTARGGRRRPEPAPDTLTLASADGTVEFALRASPSGLLVQRTQRQAVGTRLVQCMVFSVPDGFDCWCESEPMHFEDPVLYDRLRRQGHEGLDGKR